MNMETEMYMITERDEDVEYDHTEKEIKLIEEIDIAMRLQQKPYLEAVHLMRAIPIKECPYEKLFLL